jgi:hypothetical protein
MRLFKYVLLSLSPAFYMDIRAEARRRNISVITLIRDAVKWYTSDPRLDPNILLHKPIVAMTPEEEKQAERILKRHFDEDREEFYLG